MVLFNFLKINKASFLVFSKLALILISNCDFRSNRNVKSSSYQIGSYKIISFSSGNCFAYHGDDNSTLADGQNYVNIRESCTTVEDCQNKRIESTDKPLRFRLCTFENKEFLNPVVSQNRLAIYLKNHAFEIVEFLFKDLF